jgi:branched-chain amino acid transport system substrate-binding protein
VTETYGKVVAPAILKKYGVQILESIDFLTEDVDFSAQITRVKAANPDGIVLAGEHHIAANIAREVRKQGLKQPFIGDVFINSSDFIRLGGPSVEGTYTVTTFWEGNPDPKVQTFVRNFMEKHKQDHGKDANPAEVGSGMYDTCYITRFLVGKMGISGKPEDLQKDREKIRDGWATLKDFIGVQGKTSIDKNGDSLKEYYTLVVKGGKWDRVKE